MTTEFVTLEASAHAYDLNVAKEVADALERHYPGWMWMVSVPPKGGIAQVRSGYMDMRMGFVVRLVDSYSASQLAKEAVRAGGELLERTNMPRSRFDHQRRLAAANKNVLDVLTFQR